MIGVDRLIDRQRAPVERLGVGVAALSTIEFGLVAKRDSDRRVVGAERRFADGEIVLDERLGFGVAALGLAGKSPYEL